MGVTVRGSRLACENTCFWLSNTCFGYEESNDLYSISLRFTLPKESWADLDSPSKCEVASVRCGNVPTEACIEYLDWASDSKLPRSTFPAGVLTSLEADFPKGREICFSLSNLPLICSIKSDGKVIVSVIFPPSSIFTSTSVKELGFDFAITDDKRPSWEDKELPKTCFPDEGDSVSSSPSIKLPWLSFCSPSAGFLAVWLGNNNLSEGTFVNNGAKIDKEVTPACASDPKRDWGDASAFCGKKWCSSKENPSDRSFDHNGDDSPTSSLHSLNSRCLSSIDAAGSGCGNRFGGCLSARHGDDSNAESTLTLIPSFLKELGAACERWSWSEDDELWDLCIVNCESDSDSNPSWPKLPWL